MHEMSIVFHLAESLQEIARERNLDSISSVTLQVGEVSGIITDYFVDCWNYFRVRNPLLHNCELVLETIRAYTYCDSCHKSYETVKYGRQCPWCGSYETWLIDGNQCIIKQIEVDDDEPEGNTDGAPSAT
ncbi:MAG: hydrogenase maturation nickel metallochaperone HypA [Erysipelotrichaceae bacterium]|nr:hydrogenase maturation nickel metallochaperone HypA [Erysipelotrichaceae bacterium]